MNNSIDLTLSTSESSADGSNSNYQKNCVYIVFFQAETWHGSVFSGNEHHSSPENLNKECIGVYRSIRAANTAARNHWENEGWAGYDDDEDVLDEDGLVNILWDGSAAGKDISTLSKRVYVEEHKLE
eukprot:CAMPEP_0194138398 /NCGR_PEP_ID=MMETSP0152-20130528/8190_1 /TAXON_ID=1049557 /ORGANISM="Thalassiothrix antarctica, Strain L6-D1" /LENGTH=126 /DNA_ID=CAMNT_0038835833 /DNA_START=77 /DNA_END=457 /DNA_ORIENTATION=-